MGTNYGEAPVIILSILVCFFDGWGCISMYSCENHVGSLTSGLTEFYDILVKLSMGLIKPLPINKNNHTSMRALSTFIATYRGLHTYYIAVANNNSDQQTYVEGLTPNLDE